MTTQTAVFSGLPTGQTLTAKLFTLVDPDTVAYTSDSTVNRTNATDEYVFTFGEAVAISGNYTIKVFSGAVIHGTGKRTFAGVDAELATVTPEVAALDTATQTQIDTIEAVVSGTVTGAGTSTEIFVGSSATVTITVDSSGNRSAVVVT